MISLAGKVDPSLKGAIDQVSKTLKGIEKSQGVSKAFWSGVGKVGAAAMKGIAAAAGATMTAVTAVGSAALGNYASYEQLVGGVETLFKDSAGTVQQYAAEAYKTAGVSANTYMEQATAFSASLIQGLDGDTQKAAQYADLAIKDMSDNANKMGTNIESIQQTYQSLMRGNYAMLDNLKLGYGGTKTELERLVKDASELTGQALDPSKFSDVITAIHAVQENMGITGTTALEAATTIEGSVNTMKAAWSNWLTGLGTEGADMGALTSQLVESIGAVADNVGPAVLRIAKSIVTGLPGALSGLASSLGPQLAGFLSQAWNYAVTALSGIGINLPRIDMTQVQAAFQQVQDVISSLVNGPLGQAVGNFVSTVFPPLMSALSSLLPFLASLANAILPPIINFITPIASTLANIAAAVLPMLTGAINALNPVIQFLITAFLTLAPAISGVFTFFSTLMGPVSTLGSALMPAISSAASSIGSAFQALSPSISAVIGFFQSLWSAISPVVSILGSLVSLVGQAASGLASLAGGAIGGIASFLGFARGGFTTGPYIAGEDPRYPNEAVISFNPAYRAQNVRYWQMAGHMLGAYSASMAPATAAASGGGGTVIDLSGMTYSPKVEVRGNASKDDIVAALRQSQAEFGDFLTEVLAGRAEVAYA